MMRKNLWWITRRCRFLFSDTVQPLSSLFFLLLRILQLCDHLPDVSWGCILECLLLVFALWLRVSTALHGGLDPCKFIAKVVVVIVVKIIRICRHADAFRFGSVYCTSVLLRKNKRDCQYTCKQLELATCTPTGIQWSAVGGCAYMYIATKRK